MNPTLFILAALWMLILTIALSLNGKGEWAIASAVAFLFLAFLSAVAVKDMLSRPDEFDARKVDAEWKRCTRL